MDLQDPTVPLYLTGTRSVPILYSYSYCQRHGTVRRASGRLDAAGNPLRCIHELIASARSRITLATYSAGKVDDIIDALDKRRRDGIEVRLLLETVRSDGSGPDCPNVFKHLIPYVNALEWPRAARKDHDWTSMHVKILIRDDDAVLVTSANLSRAAMRDNMELGVELRGGTIARRLLQHFDDLEALGLLRPL